MKLNIKTTNLTLTEDLKSYIEGKLGGLERFSRKFGQGLEAWIEVGRITEHHKEGDVYRAEMDIRVPGKILRAQAAKSDIFMAIDEVRDEMERQLKEYRGKLWAKFTRGARKFKDILRFGKFLK